MHNRAHQPTPRRRPRAFTLLEMVVALTIIATVLGLASVVWLQVFEWSGEQDDTRVLLRTDRFADIARRQWGARAEVFDPDEDGGPPFPLAHINAGTLRFICDAPILFPDAPLVVASYTIEPPIDLISLPDRTDQQLIYTEQVVTNPGQPWNDLAAAMGVRVPQARVTAGARSTIIALEAARNLRFEAWFDGFDPRRTGQVGWQAIDPEHFDQLFRAPNDRENAAEPSDTPSPAPARPGSRPAAAPSANNEPQTLPRALRLTGTLFGEEVTWLFVDAG